MTFETADREYQRERASELVGALRRDGIAAAAARRPASTFLEAWIADFDDGAAAAPGADAAALEILYLCHQYRLGVFRRDDGRPSGRVVAGGA